MRFVSGCTFLTYQEFFLGHFDPGWLLLICKAPDRCARRKGKGKEKRKEREEERIEGSKDEGKEGVYHY